MGMLYEYSNDELKAMGLLTEQELTQKERMRDKWGTDARGYPMAAPEWYDAFDALCPNE